MCFALLASFLCFEVGAGRRAVDRAAGLDSSRAVLVAYKASVVSRGET
jgi:hypothetical protein